LRVLHVYKDYYPPVLGGIEGHINILAKGLLRRGVEVEVLVSNTRATLERQNIDGVPVTRIPQLGRFASAPLNATFPLWLRRLKKKFDIIHFHFPNPTGEMSYLVSGLGCQIVTTYHSDIVRQAKLGKIYSPFMHGFLSCSRVLITSSRNYQESSRILSRYREKCRVIPFGVDLERFDAARKKIGEISSIRKRFGPFIVLFVGRFRYYKGLDVLVRAMQRVKGKLLLLGGGPMENDLREMVRRTGTEDRVFFLGELSDDEVTTHLHACDIFVLPSTFRSEAFGIVLLEAMACSRPVISTQLGTGTTYVNQDGKTGLVIPPHDAPALAEAIDFFRMNPDMGRKMGEAGRERVESLFTVDRMVEEVLQVYRDVLSEGKGVPRLESKSCFSQAEDRSPPEKIRILRIISRMNIGGPSLHVYYLTVGLSRDRFESRLALGQVSAQEGSMEDLFSDTGMTLEKIAELRREINFRRDLKAFFKILALILAFKPQIVHTHMSKAGYLGRTAVFLLRLFGRRRIVAVHTFHGNVFSGYFSRWKSRLFLVVERLLGKVTDAIIAVSEGQRRDLLDRFRIAGPEKIRAIPLGFNLGPFLHGEALRGRFRQSLGFGRDVKLVGIVGRLVPVKNHSLFLEAVSRVRSLAREEGTRFVIVGDGVLRKDLEGLSRDLGVAERVVFCGWRRDMASVYADLDLLCLTSVNEGTPVTVIEAMASGVPVAATGVGGVPDLLGPKIRVGGHGSYAVCERGLMCRSEDVDSVAGAVQDVLQGSVPELPRCVARARSYVKQCYSKERLVADIEALYEELMKRTGRVS